MTKSESHYLTCQDRECEKYACLARRDYEQRLRWAESERDAYMETLTRISKVGKNAQVDWAVRVAQSILGFYGDKK